MESLFDAESLRLLLNEAVANWHLGPISSDHDHPFYRLSLENLRYNFMLWHEEDEARDPHADAQTIAAVKRSIDGLNQQRNDAMERLDEYVLDTLEQAGIRAAFDRPLHSESVGAVVDRLAILALKGFHMREQSEREDAEQSQREQCATKLAILTEQQQDLAHCLACFQQGLVKGQLRFKVYRQMKMYNDPSLNPVLIRQSQGRSKGGGG